jgi:hypothetical protein
MADQSFTITEWCKLRRYSRSEFYRIKARGEAPDTIGVGRATRITPDADKRWLADMEAKFSRTREKAA